MPINPENEKFIRAQKATELLVNSFPQISRVRLFGSVARGTPRPSSDIDLLVVLKNIDELLRDDTFITPKMSLIREMVNHLLDEGISYPNDDLRGPVSLLVYLEQEYDQWFGCIKDAIESEGIPLYP